MALYALDGVAPQVAATAWVADSAEVMGDVVVGEDSSIWFGAVVRGDNQRITIGRGSNVQDLSVLHTDKGVPLTIGDNVTIGHQVTLHGCSVGDGALIGIGAVLLNGARIGKNCLVGAGALVTEGQEFPDGSLIMGRPATLARALTPAQIEGLQRSAEGYVANAQRFRHGLQKLT